VSALNGGVAGDGGLHGCLLLCVSMITLNAAGVKSLGAAVFHLLLSITARQHNAMWHNIFEAGTFLLINYTKEN